MNIDKESIETSSIQNLRKFLHIDSGGKMSTGGHPSFIPLTLEEIDLHARKNRDYAKGGDPLGNFKRVANILSNYPGLDLSNPAVVAIVYALKQLDAALWMIANKYEGNVEGVDERLREDRKSTRLNSSHIQKSRMPSSA